MGDEIRNEKVTPIGSPALVKPINNGIEEQEQNGVTVPNKAEIIFAPNPLFSLKFFYFFLVGKNFVYMKL